MGSGILVYATVASAETANAVGNKAPRAGNTQFIFLDMTPLGSYEVLKNQGTFLSTGASPAGSVSFRDATTSGDQFILTFGGVDPFPPSQPANLTAAGQTNGCARLTWTTPPPAEYVSDYRIYWGLAPGAYVDSTTIDLLRVVNAGGNSSFTVCGFTSGTYYFAIRARNQFDLWSPISNEDGATISGGDPQGPPAPTNVAAAENTPGCGLVGWNAVGDPTVIGYRVFVGTLSVAQGQAASYEDSTDAGSNTWGQICGLSAGTHYFAVKSLTAGGASSVYSAEVSATLIGPDTEGPVLLSSDPADAATGVPINTTVCFEISDPRSGVDVSTLQVLVDGAAPSVSTSGGGTTYYVQTVPAANLPANSTIDVSVTVADLASPANVSVLTWSFETSDFQVVDTTPPVIAAVRPRPDDVGVDPLAPVVISITDDGLGVDVSSLALLVDDAPVTFMAQGAPSDLTIRYEHPGGFTPGATVAVRMEACDLAAVANCASPLTMTFTVAGGPELATTAPGAIVPDGFWAGDSDRPLEVRNLPIHWTIRIFDAAGQQVRRFRNNVSEDFTWIWDFTNDHGSRVAHALYLVRVVDAGGGVRQTGRFVVQTDR